MLLNSYNLIIRNRLSVVAATCVWRVQRKDLPEAWKQVCQKREECDRCLKTLEGLEFFFSAIGVKEPPKREKEKDQSEECEEIEIDDENGDSGVSESQQISQNTNRRFAMAAEKKRFPSFAFWMAFTSSTGANVSSLPIEKALLSCDLEIHVQVQKTAEKSMTSLFQVHSSSYFIELVHASFQATISDLEDQLSSEGVMSSPMDRSTENVVFFYMNPSSKIKQQMSNALYAMQMAGLRVDILDAERNEMATTTTPEKCLTSDSKVLLLAKLERAMESLGYKV